MFRQSYSGPNPGSLCPFGADSKTQLYLLLKLLDAASDLPLSMDMHPASNRSCSRVVPCVSDVILQGARWSSHYTLILFLA